MGWSPTPPKPPTAATPDGDPRGDQALIDAYARGDVRAFEILYSRHREFVARVARRLCRDEAEGMDVFQDAFAKLVEHAPRLKLTAKLTTWMYIVVRNLVVERRRKEGGLRLVSGDAGAALAASEEAPTSTSRSAAQISDRLAKLPDDQREVVMLRIVEGLSVEETSIALSIPEGTVKSRLHHALKILQEPA